MNDHEKVVELERKVHEYELLLKEKNRKEVLLHKMLTLCLEDSTLTQNLLDCSSKELGLPQLMEQIVSGGPKPSVSTGFYPTIAPKCPCDGDFDTCSCHTSNEATIQQRSLHLGHNLQQSIDETSLRKPRPPPKPSNLRKTHPNSVQKRLLSIKELFLIENEYQTMLSLLRDEYFVVFRNSDVTNFFGHPVVDTIELILDKQTLLVKELKSVMNKDAFSEVSFFDLLQEYHTPHPTFKSYLNNLNSMFEIIETARREPSIDQKLNEIESALKSKKIHFTRLESLLKVPICYTKSRENLLKTQFLKTDTPTPILDVVSFILNSIEGIQVDIEEFHRSHVEKLHELSQLLSIIGLATIKRIIIKNGVRAGRVRKCGRISTCRIYLFNDLLIIRAQRKYRFYAYKNYVFHLNEVSIHGLPAVAVKVSILIDF